MSLSPSPNMGLILPTPGGDAGEWGDELNACFVTPLDSHDHSTGKGVPVTPLGLNIDADLSFGTNSATHLKSADFDEIDALDMTGARRFFVNSSDHELYFRSASGVNIKITSGSTINVSLVGGIGGDYATAGALLSYDDATRRYLLQQEGSPRPWAGLATADIDLYQKAASIVNKVTLKSPSALAASYALTLPAALPTVPQALAVDTSGNVTAQPGLWLNRQVLTSGTTATRTPGTNTIIIREVAGGGGGGGASEGGSFTVGVGAGGASGFYLETVIPLVTGNYTYAIGAGGAAGANTGGNGGQGGNTTFTVTTGGVPTTYTAIGGLGGTGSSNLNANTTVAGGVATSAGSSVGHVGYSESGGPGAYDATILRADAGRGGSTPFGPGGVGQISYGSVTIAGNAGLGRGGGGGGAIVIGGTHALGGAGQPGLIIIDEYL